MIRILLPLLLTVVAGCASTPSTVTPPSAPTLQSGLLLDGFDRNVRPQDDLFRFAGGRWLDTTAIPADKSSYGLFTQLQEQAELHLRAIAEAAVADTQRQPGSDTQKIGDFYASFMDASAIDAAGLTPVKDDFARIDALSTRKQLARYLGASQREPTGTPLAYYVSQDAGDATRYIGTLGQGGLTMPDRDYYLKDDPANVAFRAQHLQYVEKLLGLAGESNATEKAKQIAAFETQIARVQWSKVQNRDPVATYNKRSIDGLRELAPEFEWAAYFEGAGVPPAEVDVNQPTYVKGFAKLSKSAPLGQWRTYLKFRILDAAAPYLATSFADAHFDFHQRALRSVEAQPERWKRGVRLLNANVGQLLGKTYVAEHFKPEAKARMQTLVANLVRAFDVSIDDLAWMGPETRVQAKQKLAKFSVKIGYPDVWQDYSALDVKPADLFGNVRRSSRYEFQRDVAKLNAPIDRTEWHMTPQTINAYYSPVMNEIVFPAAILQPPFFDVNADDAANYGAIGAVIGHEVSHGFDDSGRQYDGAGNLRDWWTAEDATNFKARADRLVAQFDAYKVLDTQSVNGRLTLGENIGDLSGMAVAYRAWLAAAGDRKMLVIDGFTGPQRFFLGWAQAWRHKYRDNQLRMMLVTDPHSPSEFRVNGPISNIDAFYDAFGVQPGDRLYRAPEDRVTIW